MPVDSFTQHLQANGGWLPRHLSDGLLVIDDYSLTDPSELRSVVAEVESFLDAKQGIRLSILSGEEWLEVLNHSLSPALRRGAERHLHILRDKADPFHLIVSPSAVSGINEGSRVIHTEVVTHVLRCIPTELSTTLRRGLDDILVESLGEILGVELFARTFPAESDLIRNLITVLSAQYGHEELEWARLLRRNPERALLALGRSHFAAYWLRQAKQQPEFAALLPEGAKREIFAQLLGTETLAADDPVFTLTRESLRAYLDALAGSGEETR